MNILFYVEPLIERDDPYWKEGWATSWCTNIAQTLTKSSFEYNFVIAVNEPISQRLNCDGFMQKVIFTQAELLKPFNGGYLEASKAWYCESYTSEQYNYYVNMMKKIFSEFAPDVIITFTPVPFLKELFPNALVLYHEYSIFSRLPFPQSWFFDVAGVYENSFLSTFKKDIQKISIDDTQQNLINKFKTICSNVFYNNNNPFLEQISKHRKMFRYLVLLPIQFSGYYAFDALVNFKSQYEYLIYVLENVPEDIGIIITMHPTHSDISNSAIEFIKSKYKNAIFIEKTKLVYATSPFIIPLVDAVITVSSSTGLQTILFDKKLITLGGNCFDFISDTKSLENIYDILQKDYQNKDQFLYFYVTKYAILDKYITNPEWLSNFFNRSLEKFREKNININFYDVIDKDDIIFEYLINFTKSTCNNYAIIYVDVGKGFSEEDSIKSPVTISKNIATVNFDLSKFNNITKLRFDPVENYHCSCKLIKINTDAQEVQFRTINACLDCNGTFIFIDKDPMIEILGDFKVAKFLELKYEFNILTQSDIIEYCVSAIAEQNSAIVERNSAIAERNSAIAERDSAIVEYNHLNLELELIYSSYGYRLLQKLRKFTLVFFRK